MQPSAHTSTCTSIVREGGGDEIDDVCARVSRLFIDDLAAVPAATVTVFKRFHAAATYKSHISGARYCAVVVRAITSWVSCD